MPDMSTLSRVGDAPRLRAEWNTRDTINNRAWSISATEPSGTSGTSGAPPPAPSRQDTRFWGPDDTIRLFPGASLPTRPGLPATSLQQTTWLDGMDRAGQDVTRELRGIVKEGIRAEDTAARLSQRFFEHQWIPETQTAQRVSDQLAAAEQLRFKDWRSASNRNPQ